LSILLYGLISPPFHWPSFIVEIMKNLPTKFIVSSILVLMLVFGFALTGQAQVYHGGSYILLSSYYSPPGTAVAVQGYQFFPNELINVAIGTQIVQVRANARGEFRYNFTPGFTTAGQEYRLNITATGATSRNTQRAELVVSGFYTWLTLNRYYASPGSQIVINGHGFSPNEVVSVYWGNQLIANVRANTQGTFSRAVIVPRQVVGVKWIQAVGQTSRATTRTIFHQAP
jgi:hypothetical protein